MYWITKTKRRLFVAWCNTWLQRSFIRRWRREHRRTTTQVCYYNTLVNAGVITGPYKSYCIAGRRY